MSVFLFLFSLFIIAYASQDFVIRTKECLLPHFPAFSEELNATYTKLAYRTCSDLDLLTYTKVNDNRAYLYINESVLNQYYKSKEDIDCCFQYIYRNGSEEEPDIGIRTTDCQRFYLTREPLDHDTVLVKCYIGADKIYSNVHRPIVVTAEAKSKIRKNNLRNESRDRPISVLLVVIDSISRLNTIRTLPKTRNYLLKNNFIEFIGYNKIDDNTYPNFNALLTGLNVGQSDLICRPEEIGKLDECPMIWYNYRNSGYITAYAEDWAHLNTYNYLKKGFLNPPTDYYFKPYFEAADSIFQRKLDTMPYCAGPETQGERLLNLAKDFSTTFKNHPTFGIFWMNTFSHNYINTPTRMDEKVRDFFKSLKSNGILDESVVFLLSDHGIRFGEQRKTIQGWYEERLPINMISVPAWFQEKYPGKFRNIQNNSKKFTSTYDVYMTLQEILHLSTGNYRITNSKACQSCGSLFSELPENRGCRDAGVPEVWCTCIGKFTTTDIDLTDEITRQAANVALQSVEGYTEIDYVQSIISSALSRGVNRRKYLLVTFETSKFEKYQALFRVSGKPLLLGKLLRLTRVY